MVSLLRWRRIHLPRQQGLAYRFRSELGEARPQRADARRERVTVILDDVVKLLGERVGFFVGQLKVLHGPDTGPQSQRCYIVERHP